jgi:hypothetical protein
LPRPSARNRQRTRRAIAESDVGGREIYLAIEILVYAVLYQEKQPPRRSSAAAA